MGFGVSDFQKLFLKNYFKQVLQEKEQFNDEYLEDVCKLLADLHVKEFGVTYPYAIIEEYKSVENWLRKKISDMKYDPKRP